MVNDDNIRGHGQRMPDRGSGIGHLVEAEFKKDGVALQPGLIEIAQDGSEPVFKPRFFQVFPKEPDRFGVAVQSQDMCGPAAVLDELTPSPSNYDHFPSAGIIEGQQALDNPLDICGHANILPSFLWCIFQAGFSS
jgi:hypothetical protein